MEILTVKDALRQLGISRARLYYLEEGNYSGRYAVTLGMKGRPERAATSS